MVPGWQDALNEVADPRAARGVRHRLDEMLVIVLIAVICGAEDCEDIVEFGQGKEPWLRTFLGLKHGVPSEDTFRRILAALDPDALEACMTRWLKGWKGYQRGKQVAVDGKRPRRSFDQASGKAAIHMIGAWATESGIALGQLAVDSKENEITALPGLLKLLDPKGATVTLDAMGCQTAIAGQIVEQGGDYLLALKANQPTLHEDAKLLLDEGIARGFDGPHDSHEEADKGHGRVETRRVWVTDDIAWFTGKDRWPGLRTWVAVECERTTGDHTSVERRYFISSLPPDAKTIGSAVRQHWHIENRLRWILDVAFSEDRSRLRTGHSAENLARLGRLALSLLKRETTNKRGIKSKRLRAGWDESYLLKLLAS
jgi:predicted transposase YbfD/YdcC